MKWGFMVLEGLDNYQIGKNEVFNPDFSLPGLSGSFPAGWQPAKRGRNSSIVWDTDCTVRIHSNSHRITSIAQQQKYRIPVYREQVWKVVVNFRSNQKTDVVIIVHFNSSPTHITRAVFEFAVDPEDGYFEGLVYIPPGVSYCHLEIGLDGCGTVWITDVNLGRIYPIHAYDADARGRLNINSVESVRSICGPVTVKGEVVALRQTVDLCEEVVAGTDQGYSSVHDVIFLSSCSFCVLNQGSNDVLISLQASPDGQNWLNDPAREYRLGPGQINIFVGNYFLRYLRLVFLTTEGTSVLRVYFQGQG